MSENPHLDLFEKILKNGSRKTPLPEVGRLPRLSSQGKQPAGSEADIKFDTTFPVIAALDKDILERLNVVLPIVRENGIGALTPEQRKLGQQAYNLNQFLLDEGIDIYNPDGNIAGLNRDTKGITTSLPKNHQQYISKLKK